jgi:tetratricopeptide (TPR) repeat protein
VHQDYVLRMIQQMTMVITRALKLRNDEEYEEALAEIQHGYSLMSGLPPSLVFGLSEEDLITFMSSQGRMNSEYCFALAELLKEEAITYEEMGESSQALPRLIKSMRLYLEAIDGNPDDHLSYLDGLNAVTGLVSPYDIPPQTRSLLLPYLEMTGQYDKAENTYVAWGELSSEPDAKQATLAFYQRMLTHEDADLIVGGLTHDEVTMALADLESSVS